MSQLSAAKLWQWRSISSTWNCNCQLSQIWVEIEWTEEKHAILTIVHFMVHGLRKKGMSEIFLIEEITGSNNLTSQHSWVPLAVSQCPFWCPKIRLRMLTMSPHIKVPCAKQPSVWLRTFDCLLTLKWYLKNYRVSPCFSHVFPCFSYGFWVNLPISQGPRHSRRPPGPPGAVIPPGSSLEVSFDKVRKNWNTCCIVMYSYVCIYIYSYA